VTDLEALRRLPLERRAIVVRERPDPFAVELDEMKVRMQAVDLLAGGPSFATEWAWGPRPEP
jgi:hypothetical protein